MVYWGLNVLIYHAVAYISGAIGVYHCLVIIILNIVSSNKYVELDMLTIFGLGPDKLNGSHSC